MAAGAEKQVTQRSGHRGLIAHLREQCVYLSLQGGLQGRPADLPLIDRRNKRVRRVVAPGACGENTALSPDDIRAMLAYIRQHRTAAEPFDVVLSGPPLAAEQYVALADPGRRGIRMASPGKIQRTS